MIRMIRPAPLVVTSSIAPGTASALADLSPVGTYLFQDTLSAQQSGVASLTAVDPLAQGGFVSDTLYGQTRQVYQFSGNTTPSQQAGR